MKKLSLIITLFAAALALNACGPDGTIPIGPIEGTTPIGLTATVTPFTGATGTSFAEGDAIGVYVLNTATWVDNGKFTLTGGEWVGDKEYKWYLPDTLQSAVTAYYPYKAGQQISDGATFSVASDQSTEAAYKASDLMLAGTTTLPTASKVSLQFVHALSQIVLTVDNQSGGTISGVELQNIATNITVNLVEQKVVAATGAIGTVIPARLNSSADSRAAIVVPQTAKLRVAVSVDSELWGEPVEEEITFASGKRYDVAVTLNPASSGDKMLDFSYTVSDWGTGDELSFHKDSDGSWVSKGEAMYIDGLMSTFYSIIPLEFAVKLEEDLLAPGRYRLVNPYADDWYTAYPASSKVAAGLEGEIIINAADPQKVYIEKSFFGYYDFDLGDFYVETVCAENGYTEEELTAANPYGSLVDGVITFSTNNIFVRDEPRDDPQMHRWTSRPSNVLTVTLPGGKRPEKFFGVSSFYLIEIENPDTAPAALFNLVTNIDAHDLRIGLFNGTFSSAEAIKSKIEQMATGAVESQPIEISGGGYYTVSLPVPASGSYTAIVYQIGPDGTPYYRSASFVYVASDYQIPPCELEIVSVAPTSINPESQIVARIKCNDFGYGQAIAVPTQELANYHESYYPSIVRQNGNTWSVSYSEFISSDEGCDIWVSRLQPETEYTLIFYARTNMYAESCKWATVTTGKAPTDADWTLLGTGTYSDNSRLFKNYFVDDAYVSNVEIYQKADGSQRYRVMAPYAEFWKNASDEVLERYAGASAEYADFYTKSYSNGKTYVYYAPYSTGYLDDYGMLYVWHVTEENIMPWNWRYTYNNIMISEGVYQLAPWYYIFEYGGGYCYSDYSNTILITLPSALNALSTAPASVAASKPLPVALAPTVPELDGSNMVRVLNRIEPLDPNFAVSTSRPTVGRTK